MIASLSREIGCLKHFTNDCETFEWDWMAQNKYKGDNKIKHLACERNLFVQKSPRIIIPHIR